ncbi:MAG TPA: BrnA antitoxin family protein [Pyrinomonadaceae bacterium]|nr:BrnA antitoxin family protein [Pyrinomonadaceae bacterium]
MRKSKEKEVVYEMTQKDYDKGLAKGWDADDMLSVGQHKFRPSRWAEKIRSSKTKVSIYLDNSVIEYFRDRAEQPNAAPYQTQINNELRKVMENGSKETATVERDILNDRKFLEALKKKLETI